VAEGGEAEVKTAAKGVSSLQLARDVDSQQKTAFVLCHKPREAMAAEVEGETLDDVVEMDDAYFGGHIRPANLKEERVDRRLAQHQTGARRVVVILRERGGRTLPFVCRAEAEGVEIAKRIVDRLAVIHTDEASHWDALHAGWSVKRINHFEAYSFDGSCTNQAESYFSRLRRMVTG